MHITFLLTKTENKKKRNVLIEKSVNERPLSHYICLDTCATNVKHHLQL